MAEIIGANIRLRFKLSCGHWTPVVDGDEGRRIFAAGEYLCTLSAHGAHGAIGTVGKSRRLKDSAQLGRGSPLDGRPNSRQRAKAANKEANALRDAMRQGNPGARHWRAS